MKKGNFAPKLLGLGVISAAVLAACGGGGSSSALAPASTSVSGVASKGIISGALVTAYCTAASGPSAVLGTATTGADGSYTITYTGSCSTPVHLVMTIPASGAQMFDEVTGQNSAVQAGALTLNSFLSSSASTNQAQITPFTDMAAAVISNAIAASGASALNSSTVGAAITAVQQQLFPSNPNLYYVKPVTPASAAAATGTTAVQQKQLSALLTSIAARAHKDHGGDFESAMQELETSIKASTQITTISGNVVANVAVPAGVSSPTAIMNQAISDAQSIPISDAEAARQIQDDSSGLVPTTPVSGTISAPTPGLTAAKNLIDSLRTNLKQLSNSSNTGFLNTQIASLKPDFKGVGHTASGVIDFMRVSGLASGAFGYLQQNPNTTLPYTVYGKGGTSCTYATGTGMTCTWGYGVNPTTGMPYFHTTVFTVTSPTSTSTYPQTYTLKWTDNSSFTGTQTKTLVDAAGDKTFMVSGDVGQLDGNSDHTTLNLAGKETVNATTGNIEDAIDTAVSGVNNTVVNKDANSNALFTVTMNSGNYVFFPGSATALSYPVSGSFNIKAVSSIPTATNNYEFDGTLNLPKFSADLSGTSYFPDISFTGSITNLTDSTVGKFMTGTLTETPDLSKFNTSQPTGPSNYKMETIAFNGSLTAPISGAAAAYKISNFIEYLNHGAFDQTDISLTYTDPSGVAISVTITKSPTGAGELKATGNGITLDDKIGTGGTISDSTTQYGTVSGNQVNYTDGTFESLN